MDKVQIEKKVPRRPELELISPRYQKLTRPHEKPKGTPGRHYDQDPSSLTLLQVDPERKLRKNSKLALLSELEKKLNIELSKSTIAQISEKLQGPYSKTFDCSVQDLYMAVQRLTEIIRNYEILKITQGIFFLGKQEISLNINNQDTAVAEKMEIQTVLLNSIQNRSKSQYNDISVPVDLVEALNHYETDMCKAFEASVKEDSWKEQVKCLNKSSVFFAEQQSNMLRQAKLEQAAIKYDLDWQKDEFKLLKTQLKCKKNEVVNKELELTYRYNNLRKHRLSMAHESVVFEQKIENFEGKKELLSQVTDKISDLIQGLTVKSVSPKKNPPPEICTSFQNTQDEISYLESELKALETQFKKASPAQAESLHTQIYRVKTKISGLKSIQMLKSTFQSAKSAKNLMQNFTKVYSVRTACPHKTTGGFGSNKSSPLNTSAKFNFSQIEKESVKSTDKKERRTSLCDSDYLETRESENEKKDSSNYKEARLIDKEEELRRKEERLVKALEKIGNEGEMELIKEEIVNLSRVKRFYESRQKQLENKLIENDRIKESLREKEKDLENKIEETEELNSKLRDDKKDLLVQLENVKLFIEENLSGL